MAASGQAPVATALTLALRGARIARTSARPLSVPGESAARPARRGGNGPAAAQLDVPVAYHRQPPEGAPHHSPALALEPGNDPGVSYRGRCRACPVGWLCCGSPQVVHDRCKFGVGPGGIGSGQPLLQLRHRQPALRERRERVRDALAVGVGARAACKAGRFSGPAASGKFPICPLIWHVRREAEKLPGSFGDELRLLGVYEMRRVGALEAPVGQALGVAALVVRGCLAGQLARQAGRRDGQPRRVARSRY